MLGQSRKEAELGSEEPVKREREMPQVCFGPIARKSQPRGHLASVQKSQTLPGLQVKETRSPDHGSAHSSEINSTSEIFTGSPAIEQIRRDSHNGHSTEIHENEDQEAVEVRPGIFSLGGK
jgi:hypothetical protein